MCNELLAGTCNCFSSAFYENVKHTFVNFVMELGKKVVFFSSLAATGIAASVSQLF